MEKQKDEQNEQTASDVSRFMLPVLQPRRGWDIVTLPGSGDVVWMVR